MDPEKEMTQEEKKEKIREMLLLFELRDAGQDVDDQILEQAMHDIDSGVLPETFRQNLTDTRDWYNLFKKTKALLASFD